MTATPGPVTSPNPVRVGPEMARPGSALAARWVGKPRPRLPTPVGRGWTNCARRSPREAWALAARRSRRRPAQHRIGGFRSAHPRGRIKGCLDRRLGDRLHRRIAMGIGMHAARRQPGPQAAATIVENAGVIGQPGAGAPRIAADPFFQRPDCSRRLHGVAKHMIGGRRGGQDHGDAVRARQVGHGFEVGFGLLQSHRPGPPADVIGSHHDVDHTRMQIDDVLTETHQHLW